MDNDLLQRIRRDEEDDDNQNHLNKLNMISNRVEQIQESFKQTLLENKVFLSSLNILGEQYKSLSESIKQFKELQKKHNEVLVENTKVNKPIEDNNSSDENTILLREIHKKIVNIQESNRSSITTDINPNNGMVKEDSQNNTLLQQIKNKVDFAENKKNDIKNVQQDSRRVANDNNEILQELDDDLDYIKSDAYIARIADMVGKRKTSESSSGIMGDIAGFLSGLLLSRFRLFGRGIGRWFGRTSIGRFLRRGRLFLRRLNPFRARNLKIMKRALFNGIRSIGSWIGNGVRSLGGSIARGVRFLGGSLGRGLVSSFNWVTGGLRRAFSSGGIIRSIGSRIGSLAGGLGRILGKSGSLLRGVAGVAGRLGARLLPGVGWLMTAYDVGRVGYAAYRAWQARRNANRISSDASKRGEELRESTQQAITENTERRRQTLTSRRGMTEEGATMQSDLEGMISQGRVDSSQLRSNIDAVGTRVRDVGSRIVLNKYEQLSLRIHNIMDDVSLSLNEGSMNRETAEQKIRELEVTWSLLPSVIRDTQNMRGVNQEMRTLMITNLQRTGNAVHSIKEKLMEFVEYSEQNNTDESIGDNEEGNLELESNIDMSSQPQGEIDRLSATRRGIERTKLFNERIRNNEMMINVIDDEVDLYPIIPQNTNNSQVGNENSIDNSALSENINNLTQKFDILMGGITSLSQRVEQQSNNVVTNNMISPIVYPDEHLNMARILSNGNLQG